MSRGEAVIIIIAVLLIGLIVWAIIDFKNKKFVLENSERIRALLEYNNTIHFETLRSRYSKQQACNSKRQLDNFSLDDYLITLIDSNEDFYRNIIQKLDNNTNMYNEYINHVGEIKSTASEDFCKQINFKYTTFIKYENRVFTKKMLPKPQVDVTIYCKATYTSPAGRNHYSKDQSYTLNELKRFFDYTIKLKEQRQTRQYQIKVERAKMSDSLRYNILKRDNFKCQICGSSAQDGVKLHVDHIIPVSKGGQTMPSNLRTLCDRCNMGKSNKL
ncbi:MAG: HNH endonuclease [Clostridia bacterium]|nr:HNH endonuclease [Clostridia bacterium]